MLRLTPNGESTQLQKFLPLLLLPQLHHLWLNLQKLNPDQLDMVHAVTRRTDFSALRLLALEVCCRGNWGNPEMEEFLQQFPNLETLYLTYDSGSPGRVSVRREESWEEARNKELKMVLERMKKLKSLSVDFGMMFMMFETRHRVQFHPCDTLEHLTVDWMKFSEVTLRAIGQCFPKLRYLLLGYGHYTGVDVAANCVKYLAMFARAKLLLLP